MYNYTFSALQTKAEMTGSTTFHLGEAPGGFRKLFLLWLEMLGQLYVAGAAVPGVIADISHRVTPVTVKTQKER